MEGLNCRHTRT